MVLLRLSLALIPLLLSNAVRADNYLNWTFHNVSFADGGTLSGAFVIDTTTNVVTALNITTTRTTSLFTGGTYNQPVEISFLTPPPPSSQTFLSQAYVSDPFISPGFFSANLGLNLFFQTSLLLESNNNPFITATSGEVVSLSSSFPNYCQSNCFLGSRYITSGYVSSSPVLAPAPPAIWLFGTGILGLFGFKRVAYPMLNRTIV